MSQWTSITDEQERRELARERRTLTALTLVAGLDAVLLALIGVQFVFLPAFIILLVVAPVIIALETLWTPAWVALESGIVVTLVALALFGPIIALWTLAYVIAGLVCGFGRRLRVPAPLRVITLGVTLLALVVATLGALFALGGLSLGQIQTLALGWTGALLGGSPLSVGTLTVDFLAAGSVLLAVLMACAIEYFARIITQRLPPEALADGVNDQ